MDLSLTLSRVGFCEVSLFQAKEGKAGFLYFCDSALEC